MPRSPRGQRHPPTLAALVVDGESHVAQLADLYEVHWYRFEARQGQDYRIGVGGRSGRAVGDVSVELSLHDSTGAPIASEADPYSLSTHWLFLRGAEERTYYVRVVGASYDPTGEYEIAVRRIADEHGDVPSAGTEIDLADGAEYTGAIDYGGDRDWFVFDAQAGALSRSRSTAARRSPVARPTGFTCSARFRRMPTAVATSSS